MDEQSSARVRVLVTVRVEPGMEQEFERVWLDVAKDVRHFPGFIDQWLSTDLRAPSTFHIISEWTDEEHFTEFETSAAHDEHKKRIARLRVEGGFTLMGTLYHRPLESPS